MNGARLGAVLAHFFDETDRVADRQAIEGAFHQRMAMEIKIATVRGLNAIMVTVRADLATASALEILQAARRRRRHPESRLAGLHGRDARPDPG
ncbi:MAG: hypothetical protein SVO96_04660 [Pseudomonadota bacterium]|nr:hypothetical protein [Pseudomonadota bacterium]